MKVSRSKYLIPYDVDGNMYASMPTSDEGEPFIYKYNWERRSDADRGLYQVPVYWFPNDPFTAALTIVQPKNHNGLRIRDVWWSDDQGRKYPMFGNNLPDALVLTNLDHGRTEHIEWVVRKHGREFGIVAFEGYKK